MLKTIKMLHVFLLLSFTICVPSIIAAPSKGEVVKKEKTTKIKKKSNKQQKASSQQKTALAELPVPKGHAEVVMITNFGKIRLDLFKDKDPETVNNFLEYVKAGYYNNTIFHRIVDGFLIQGGGYDIHFNEKNPLFPPIKNNSKNGFKNLIGTIVMARKQSDPNSATSQFFINLSNNSYLDYSSTEEGYTVFGKVISGMEIIQKIARIKIGQREGMYHVPFYPEEAIIKEAFLVE
ncbi:peptidylprolyl isomerase [Pigmentibacter ruber]|uniref:peptidylprolyl isomerase n=1 Tax=Pigmentibacter ruber TaxID=2683196 RepID=UPI00192E53F1|nr:peptidylprolyl isomerase [Pigmentibacter ruber]BFD32979.1 hypothetical protein GTC16762_25970 [Pigmentibacter ruber]